jgi:F-type H+-transporting ATPase subunit epsilon
MNVQLVAVERSVWSGKATFVFARTTEGEVGILPGHVPMLAELAHAEMVRIDSVDDGEMHAAVYGGFLSVTADGVSILAETVELRDEINIEQARSDLDSDDAAVNSRARAQLRAAGHSV